mmetsp:Transcript_20896/g.30704  ORF Transcript_20896/g.30704 Transcript_20896/m.30704 type:complete len:237 (+) Transcript_20896:922-1632(+)
MFFSKQAVACKIRTRPPNKKISVPKKDSHSSCVRLSFGLTCCVDFTHGDEDCFDRLGRIWFIVSSLFSLTHSTLLLQFSFLLNCRTVSVECCYQNVGIATSVAISMFEGSDRALAMCVPLFYGIVEAVVLGIYCIWAWKKGWTKAPKDEYFHKILINSYEVVEENSEDEKEEEETVNETELPVSETEFGDKSYSWQEDSQEKKSVVTGSSCATTDAETIREREKMAEELEPPSWIV